MCAVCLFVCVKACVRLVCCVGRHDFRFRCHAGARVCVRVCVCVCLSVCLCMTFVPRGSP